MSDFPKPLSVSDIKASFEARFPLSAPNAVESSPSLSRARQPNSSLRFPRLHRLYNQRQPTDADMPPGKALLKASTFPKPSIDSILDQCGEQTPDNRASTGLAAPFPAPPARPGTSTRPSWIGPKPLERPVPPKSAAMRRPVTIKYSSADLQPPVFIFTSLSDPPWEPVEMSAHQTANSEWTFSKTFEASEGEYQYKFRLGPGDWWVTDEKQPLVDDGDGNKNNLIIIKPEGQDRPNKIALPLPSFTAPPPLPSPAPAPLMEHEKFTGDQHKMGDVLNHTVDREGLNEYAGGRADQHPLLQHESLNPTSAEQEHAPLFRHESMAIGVYGDEGHEVPRSQPVRPDRNKLTDGHGCIPAEADVSDRSLEPFPTDKQGIYEKLRKASVHAVEDESSSGKKVSSKDSPSCLLPIVSEDEEEDEELDQLHEIEEREAQRELEEEGDPLQDEKVVASLNQTGGVVETVMNILKHPVYWVATIGLALGVAAGWYKLRYA